MPAEQIIAREPTHASSHGSALARQNDAADVSVRVPVGQLSEVYVAIADQCPASRRGMVTALHEAGFTVETVADLAGWLARGSARAGVIAIHDDAGLAALRLLCQKRPEATLVAVVGGASPAAYYRALRAGATAVVSRDTEVETMATVIATAMGGYTVLPRDIGRVLVQPCQATEMESRLSHGEVEWLRALAAGTTVAKLAGQSGYSERSLYRHLARLYRRLGASSRTEAIQAAMRSGLLE